jgi:DNA polymerase III subunit epsilon
MTFPTIEYSAFAELPWSKLCFVDVETTGSAPPFARVTEVAVVSYSLSNGESNSWSTLVNPGISIPHEIRFLTGISNDMVQGAHPISEHLNHFESLLENGLFVAHHARFDFGFLKHEFERNARPWPTNIKTLCTVRLSRLLDADKSPHSLDAIRLRYRLPNTERHRALGDALALQYFFEALCLKHGHKAVILAIKRLMSMPSLPAHLPADSLTKIPHAPGVYFFYGQNNHALYVGKSIDLRTRVATHFGQDHKSERGILLASEIGRIEYRQTPDELCALVLEQQMVHQLSPSYNVALRKKQGAVVVHFDGGITYPTAATLTLASLFTKQYYGPFTSKVAAKKYLAQVAHQQRLCLPSLGLEKALKRTSAINANEPSPCFARQVMRCRGACCGVVSVQSDLTSLQNSIESNLITLNLKRTNPSRDSTIEQDPEKSEAPWQMADGQWVRFSHIMPTKNAIWQNELFNPAIYSILSRHQLKHQPSKL